MLPRDDNYIGVMELLAPILAMGMWGDAVRHCLWTAWVYNQGVLHSLVRGSFLADDMDVLHEPA